jgi:hypothetical protein
MSDSRETSQAGTATLTTVRIYTRRADPFADLTCAALLMPAVDVSQLGGPASAGTGEESTWRARWAEHPGAAWVREIYRRHRRP